MSLLKKLQQRKYDKTLNNLNDFIMLAIRIELNFHDEASYSHCNKKAFSARQVWMKIEKGVWRSLKKSLPKNIKII